jgi:hypothetical protein
MGMHPTEEWRLKLAESFADLFGTGDPREAAGWLSCGEGWRAIIERLCGQIQCSLGPGDRVVVDRVRQKLGVLRVDWSGEASEAAAQAVMEAVNLATAASACTCEMCGAEGRLYRNRGWLATRCADHAWGYPVPPRFGIGATRAYRRRRGSTEMYYARYDRANDAMIEVSPHEFEREV